MQNVLCISSSWIVSACTLVGCKHPHFYHTCVYYWFTPGYTLPNNRLTDFIEQSTIITHQRCIGGSTYVTFIPQTTDGTWSGCETHLNKCTSNGTTCTCCICEGDIWIVMSQISFGLRPWFGKFDSVSESVLRRELILLLWNSKYI